MVGRRESGYVALMAVLIVGAAATAISLVLLASGADSQRSALIEQRSKQVRSLAIACAQEGLLQVHDYPGFSGSNTVILGGGSCTYTVTISSPTTRSIAVAGTVKSNVSKLQISATIGTLSISITSWQEVS